eukprot:TRINITY_DN1464_c0_g1_i2.p1 TRINITY_DN1464_c0_g1~~TRINITY_DN1464_c0_g1_i2.p1  ORF type:complete len:364 (+),score=52.98 TRINITY_DN1464_c0_g1_i2:114-1205(+)
MAQADAPRKLLVNVDGKQYDLTSWRDFHPGGSNVLDQYHEKDATEVFYAMHGESAFKKLKTMASVPVQEKVDPEIVAFRELRKRLIEEGFFESNKPWFVLKSITTIGIHFLAILAVYLGNWVLGAVLLGLGYQQLGWLGHDLCHQSLFKNRKYNNFYAYILGNVLNGFSVNWWKDRHNTHHAITNVLDSDPDVDNLPLFVWSEHDLHRVSSTGGWFAEAIIPYQHYYFVPFTFTLHLIWKFQSVVFLRTPETQNKSYLKSLPAEKMTIIIHWIWLLVAMALTGSVSAAISFFFISEFIGGTCLAMIVFMNHYACEQLRNESGRTANFLTLQLSTTRNMDPNPIIDWFAVSSIPSHHINTSPQR